MKLYCTAPSNPLIKDIASTYNLDAKQARAILNRARNEDPSLIADNVDFNYLKENDAFKKALEVFMDETLSEELVLNPIGVKESNLESLKEGIRIALGDNATEEQVDSILNKIDMKDTSSLDYDYIKNTVEMHKGNNAKTYNIIGSFMSHNIITSAYRIFNDKEFAVKCGVSEQYNSIADLITSEEFENYIFENTSSRITTVKFTTDKLHFILATCCKDDFYSLGVRVTPTGLLVPIRENPKDTEQNNGDGVDGITEGDSSVRDYNESDNEKDNRDKVSNYIKTVLSTFTDGVDELLKLPKSINVSKAIDTLHSICSDCDTVDEMIRMINLKMGKRAWMKKLRDALTLGNNEGFIDGMTMTDSEKETLREQFFKSMNLHFAPMATTVINKKGNITTFTPNVNSLASRLAASTYGNYDAGNVGVIAGMYIHYDEAKEVLKSLAKIGSQDSNEDITIIQEALKYIGINAGKNAIRAANIGALSDALRNAYAGIISMRSINDIENIAGYTDPIIDIIAQGTPDKQRIMARVSKKTFFSWLKPSMISTMIKKFNKSLEKRREYIDKTYGDSDWFMRKNPEAGEKFYAHELNAMYNGKLNIEYREKPSIFGKPYNELSSAENITSMMIDFFGRRNRATDMRQDTANTTWYRMFIASDKPRYLSVKMNRFVSDYKDRIFEQAFDFLEQEIRRAKDVLNVALNDRTIKIDGYDIKKNDKNKTALDKYAKNEKITINDVVKDGKYIFKGTGASFYLNKFINSEIENKTKLGKMIIDSIFNTHGDDSLISKGLTNAFNEGFEKYMESMVWDMLDSCVSNGLLAPRTVNEKNDDTGDIEEVIDAKNVEKLLQSILPKAFTDKQQERIKYFREECIKRMEIDANGQAVLRNYIYKCALFMTAAEEYCWHNWYAKTNMSEIFGADPALFSDTTNFQKRWAQIISSGETPNANATIHGEQISDGKLRSITIVTEKEKSGSLNNIRLVMERQRDSITDEKRKNAFEKNMNTTLKQLEKIDSTDGQAHTSLTGLRKKRNGLGMWSRSKTEELDRIGYTQKKDGTKKYVMTDEAVYQRWLRGESIPEDYLHVFAQPQKPFASGFTKLMRNGKVFTSIFQHKNSEYALIPMAMYAKSKNESPASIEEAFAMFMEETARKKGVQGIDTINVSSAVKVGNNSGTIYISKDMSPEEVLDKLRNSVCSGELNEENPYISGVVTEFEMDDYHIVSNKPEHFKHSRTIQGSQMKIFTVTNLGNDEKIKVSDKETMTARELREEYHNLLAKKIKMNTRRLEKAFGLNLPTELRRQKMSNTLLRIASSNNTAEAHELMSYALKPENGELRFYSPLDDPTVQSRTEAMLYSQMRRAIYSGKVNGGSVVQASSFASTDDLNIRFYSTNPADAKYGGVIPTLKEYLRDNNGKSENDYNEYIKEYQGGYAYFECEVPMPGDIRRILTQKNGKKITNFMDENGNWDMDAIRKVIDPKLLEMVCYRIPTESKYSIMACKVVRFSSEAGGSVAKYPADMVTFTGSDFDIDTTYIERRDIISDSDSKNDREEKELNNRLFDLHYAALRANGSLQEAFKNGDFSELSELSYKKVLLNHGYRSNEVDKMSSKELKEICKDIEDLDLMSPVTDDILKSQNSEAKKLIGIAAVSNASHGLLSMLGTDGKSIIIKVKNKNTEDGDIGKKTTVDDSVTFVNNKDKNKVTTLDFSGDVTLDGIYDMDGYLISEKIGNYIGASTDAAKDAAMSRLNINATTLPILVFMHRVGISSDIARLFIANPVTVEMCRKINASGGTLSVLDAISDMKKEIYNEKGKDGDKMVSGLWGSNQKISYSELLGALSIPYEELGDSRIGYLKVLSVMFKYSSKIKSLDSFVRYSSSSAMKHSSFVDRYVALRRAIKVNELDSKTSVVKLPDNLDGTCAFDKMCNAFPHIGESIKAEARLTEALILDNMHTYNSAFFNIVDKMFADADYINDESVKLGRLRDAWRNRLLFVGDNRIADFTKKEVFDKYVTNLANSLNARIAEIEQEYGKGYLNKNALINALDIRNIISNDGKSLTVLNINNDDLKGHDLLALQEDWEEMLEDELTASLAVDIAIHFLAQNAGFKPGSLASAIPIKVKDAIPNYYKAFDDANKEVMTKEEEDKFYIDFVLNNILMYDTTDYVYPRSYEKEKDKNGNVVEGVYKVTIPLNLASTRIKADVGEGGSIGIARFDVPIIKMCGDIFKKGVSTYGAVLLNNGEITDIKGKGDSRTGAVTVRLCEQKGIPNEIAEYTGNQKSYITKMDYEAVMQSLFEEEPIASEQEEQSDDELGLGSAVNIIRRSGLDIHMSPYERKGAGIELDTNETSLVSSRSSRGDNKFEESRMFLSRLNKLSSTLGIKLSKANRNASSTDASMDFYSFNMEQNDLNIPMMDQAKALASTAVLLAGGSKSALIKEYVTDINKASNIELSIPIGKNNKKEILDKAKEIGIDKCYIKNGSELIVTVNKGANRGELIKNTHDAISKLISLRDGKLNASFGEQINVYYIRRKAIGLKEATDAVNGDNLISLYENERDNRAKVRTRSPYRAINRDSSRSEDMREEGIRTLFSLARKRTTETDEGIEPYLLNFFNEMPSRFTSANRSIQSAELARDVRDRTEGNFDTMLEEQEIDEEDTDSSIDNAIINTANWLLSFDENDVKESMQRQGFREKDANRIVEEINKKLKDLNIC